MGLTYSEIARWYDLTLDELGWPDRRVTRSGLRRFLIAIYARLMEKRGLLPVERWEFIWSANRWAYREALSTWHRRLPSRLADIDRARVAAILANRMMDQKQLSALKWAKRRA
jgi:hypothetical protein